MTSYSDQPKTLPILLADERLGFRIAKPIPPGGTPRLYGRRDARRHLTATSNHPPRATAAGV